MVQLLSSWLELKVECVMSLLAWPNGISDLFSVGFWDKAARAGLPACLPCGYFFESSQVLRPGPFGKLSIDKKNPMSRELPIHDPSPAAAPCHLPGNPQSMHQQPIILIPLNRQPKTNYPVPTLTPPGLPGPPSDLFLSPPLGALITDARDLGVNRGCFLLSSLPQKLWSCLRWRGRAFR